MIKPFGYQQTGLGLFQVILLCSRMAGIVFSRLDREVTSLTVQHNT